MMALIIGMNSGSSFDGIDVVLAEIGTAEDGHPSRPKFIDGIAYDWPEDVKKLVFKAVDNELSIFELTHLNYIIGAVYAEAARTLIEKQSLKPEDVRSNWC